MINHVQGQTTKLHTIHPILDYPAPLYSQYSGHSTVKAELSKAKCEDGM